MTHETKKAVKAEIFRGYREKAVAHFVCVYFCQLRQRLIRRGVPS